jgi:GNAT superfamily N-acetyltransferase
MPTVQYFYLRMLELEGRHPEDAGAWASTFHRLCVGEGQPPNDHPAATIEYPPGAPYPPTPKVSPEVTRPLRWFFYRRFRNSAECERYLVAHQGPLDPKPSINIPLSTDWAAPAGGVIPMPTSRTLLTLTHNLFTWGCRPERRLFLFQNTWGEQWGHKGAGALPYEYFDRYCFDSWVLYHSSEDLALFQSRPLDSTGRSRWTARDGEDCRRYGYEIRSLEDDERLGWAFAVERDCAIEVEELYVRAEYRGLGHGRWLSEQLVGLASAKVLPLRAWVPFADSRRESPNTQKALLATMRRMRLESVMNLGRPVP